jgi:hypothetical protein
VTLPSPLGRGWREAPGEGTRAEAAPLIRSFGPPSPRGRRDGTPQPDRGCHFIAALAARRLSPAWPAAANQCGLRRSSQSSARSSQWRDVVGQKHEAERKHPEAENRQDGKAPADDQQYAGREARPAAGGLPEPPGDRLHPAWQPAKEPSQPPLRIGVSDIIGRGYGLRAQAPEVGSPAAHRNPYFPLCGVGRARVRRARSPWPPRRARRRSPGSARASRCGRAGAVEARSAD